MKSKKLICSVLSLMLAIICVLSGCNANKKEETSSSTENKLSYWCILNSAVSQTMSNFGETPLAKEWSKRLGVEITYIHPPLGQETEKFNLLVASNNMPDIIGWKWGDNYTGGPSKAIQEKRIIALNDYKEHAPNFFNYLAAHGEADKLSKTDEGDYFGFTFIKDDKISLTSDGPLIRKDWLDDLGLEVPETIDEWHTVLTAFKEKKGATAPLSVVKSAFTHGCFPGAWNIKLHYYVEDGVVKHGYMEPAYKEFLKWSQLCGPDCGA